MTEYRKCPICGGQVTLERQESGRRCDTGIMQCTECYAVWAGDYEALANIWDSEVFEGEGTH